jgi:hypothetical protein
MKQEIENLLANLDSPTINSLPCFLDQAKNIHDINFRIGLNEGPQISFSPETKELYYLTIRDENQRMYQHPILIGSEQFMKCQNIRDAIYTLNRTPGYSEMVKQKIGILLTNVVNIVKPIIARLSKEN